MLQLLNDAFAIAAKDIRIERRSKVGLGQIAPFALTVLLLFAFALDPDRGVLQRVASGLFWVTVLLSTILAVQRSFALEARDGLRMSAFDPAGIFLGKAAAIALQLLVLQIVLGAGVYVLYDVKPAGIGILALVVAGVTLGLATAGTIYGALASGERGRETLLPILFLPVVAPVLLGATRATESVLASSSVEAWPWIRLLWLFAAVYAVLGASLFGSVLED